MGNPRRRRRRNKVRGIVSRDTAARIDSLALNYQRTRTASDLRRISELLNSFTQSFPKLVVEEVHLYLLNKWNPREASYVRYFQKYFNKLAKRASLAERKSCSPTPSKFYTAPDALYLHEAFESSLASRRLSPLERLIAKDWILNEYTLKEISEAYNMSYRSLRVMTEHILRILAEEH